MSAPALTLRGVTAGYGGVPAIRDVDLTVDEGQVLALLGSNGAGKSTTLLSVVGAVKVTAGAIESLGISLRGRRIEQVARLGVGLVPDNRGIFSQLTVAEHLRLAKGRLGDGPTEDILDRFPKLRTLLHRRCGLLSGGEQQMLALAKTLLARPRVLMIDEMSLGLAPMVVASLLPILRELADVAGVAVLLVEQHIDLALSVADSAVVLNHGRVVLVGDAVELRSNRVDVEAAYFGRIDARPECPAARLPAVPISTHEETENGIQRLG